jgi:hypothetical protein
MMKWFLGLGSCFLCAFGTLFTAAGEVPVKFDEVFSLIRSNVVGISEAELSKAAALGLVEQLQGKVDLVESPSDAKNDLTLVTKTNLFDNSFGYIRVDHVAQGLGSKISETLKAKKLKGLVLDLRFAKGQDYTAVADVVSLFSSEEKPILKWGDQAAKTSARSDAFEIPIAALINRQTVGAAEALAGALKEQHLALLIGSHTAGRAIVFDEFPLSTGQHLKIARTKVQLASGQEIGSAGIAPDITVEVDEKNERRWLEDPYLPILKPGTPAGSAPFLTSVTNRIGRRLNGAEVARRHREELEDGETSPESPRPAPAAPKVVQDAALARALDFLKGLSSTRLRNVK